MRLFKRRAPRVDPAELDRQTESVQSKLERDGDQMNALAAYLERRKLQNGFGTDFEYTLTPRESR